MASKQTAVSNISNDAEGLIFLPFTIQVTIQGVSDLLFHRWSNEDVKEKNAAAKGSKTKKIDNIEAYLYRDENNYICMPGRYLNRAIVEAARFHQDPRSSRKMAKDLVQAAVIVPTMLAPVLVKDKPTSDWDYLDRQRVVIQRAGITRVRPAFTAGWKAQFNVTSLLPEYVTPQFLRRLVQDSGKFIGLADFRPTYGRFDVIEWKELNE